MDGVRPEQAGLGDHFSTYKIDERNALIKSGEWKQIMITDNGRYILERVKV